MGKITAEAIILTHMAAWKLAPDSCSVAQVASQPDLKASSVVAAAPDLYNATPLASQPILKMSSATLESSQPNLVVSINSAVWALKPALEA